jgi:hypothetical protein
MSSMGLTHGSPLLPTSERKLALIFTDDINQSRAEVRGEFAFGRFYATGGAVLQLLESTRVPFTDAAKAGRSLYAVAAAAHGDATTSQRASLVAAAKMAHAYDTTLVARARPLVALP